MVGGLVANAPYFRFKDLGSGSGQDIVFCCWIGRPPTLTAGWALSQTISVSFQCFHG